MARPGWTTLGLALALALVGCDGETTGGISGDSDAGPPPPTDAGPPPAPEPVPLPEPPGPPDPEGPAGDPEPIEDAPPAPPRCEGLPGEAGRATFTVSHDGRDRRAIVHVPEGYDPTTGIPVVLNFHGFTSADWQQALLTRMEDAAEDRNVMVVYPQGVGVSWNAGDCCGTAWTDAVDDVGFVRALLDALAATWCVDPARVYATGMSNGGFLSHRLACELSDRIAAVAPVAGVLGIDPAGCTPARPVPVWHFHGTDDPLVPYEGGTPVVPELGVGLSFRSVDATLDHWAANNGCADEESLFFAEGDAVCVERTGCAAPVRRCTIHGGGHTWPGGLPIPFLGQTSDDLDATAAMLDFFASHALSPRP